MNNLSALRKWDPRSEPQISVLPNLLLQLPGTTCNMTIVHMYLQEAALFHADFIIPLFSGMMDVRLLIVIFCSFGSVIV